MNKLQKTLLAIYAATAVVTFGHAYRVAGNKLSGGTFQNDPIAESMCAAVAAFGWPFYWSTVAWEK